MYSLEPAAIRTSTCSHLTYTGSKSSATGVTFLINPIDSLKNAISLSVNPGKSDDLAGAKGL